MSDIKQKTKVGMLWNVIEKISIQLISFVLNIILARLLTPNDYGTVGMLAIFIAFSNVFIDSGFSRALIQKLDRTEKDFSTTLIFNIVISVIIYITLFFCSPAIAKFYKTPELIGLQRVFFIVIIVNSFTVVQNAQLQIKVDFKKIALINSITTILSGVVGIIAAYNGLGPWALVIQSISKAIISTLCFWVIGRWIPKTGFSFTSFKKLFSFGSKLLLSGFLSATVNNIYRMIIGKVYTAESLGYYTRAGQFPDLTSGTVGSVLNTVTFPLLSSLQKENDNLINIFRRLIRITSMFVFPAMVGLAVLSEPLILVLLGEKWLPSAELLFWLCFAELFTAHNALNMNILNAIGRSDLFLKVDLVKYPFMFATMAICFPISLKAVVIGRTVTAIIYYYINTFMIGRLYGFGFFKQLACSWKYILSTFIMGLGVALINYFISSDLLSLIVGVISGVAIYIFMLFVLKDEEFNNMGLKILNKVFRRK